MMQKLNYIRCGDYYIPNILCRGKQTHWSVGTYAQRLYQGA